MIMKNIYPLLTILFVWTMTGCVEDPNMSDEIKNAKKPEIVTGLPVNGTATTITISGEITKENGAPITSCGFFWGTEEPVTFENMEDSLHITEVQMDFSALITGLSNSQQYYIRAFATNIAGTAFGENQSFETISGIGGVRTLVPIDIKAKSAVCGGVILDAGEGDIVERGVYLQKAGETVRDTIFSEMETDSFTCLVSGLNKETQYIVQAFTTNSFGSTTGEQQIFKTVSGLPVFDSFERISLGYDNAGFKVVLKTEGDVPVTTYGFCYGLQKEPAVGDNNVSIVSGEGSPTEFTGVLQDLKANIVYYVRAFAENEYGLVYSEETISVITINELPTVETKMVVLGSSGSILIAGEVLDSGDTDIIEAGVCWGLSTEPDINNSSKKIISTTVGEFEGAIFGLRGGETYYVRTYALNAKGVHYGEEVAVVTSDIFKNVASFPDEVGTVGSATSFTMDKDFYFLGGEGESSIINEMWRYNASGWKEVAPFPHKYSWMCATGFKKTAFVLGGADEKNDIKNIFYQYIVNEDGERWEAWPVTEDGPGAVSHVSACQADLSIYYVGGLRKEGNSQVISGEVWRFIPILRQWEQKTSLPEAQYRGITIAVKDTIYSGFGYTHTGAALQRSNKLMKSANNANSWELETTLPVEVEPVTGVVHKDELYIVCESGYIWKYNFLTKEWVKKSQLLSKDQPVHCMYSMGNYIYIGMGSNNMLISYDPAWDNIN